VFIICAMPTYLSRRGFHVTYTLCTFKWHFKIGVGLEDLYEVWKWHCSCEWVSVFVWTCKYTQRLPESKL